MGTATRAGTRASRVDERLIPGASSAADEAPGPQGRRPVLGDTPGLHPKDEDLSLRTPGLHPEHGPPGPYGVARLGVPVIFTVKAGDGPTVHFSLQCTLTGLDLLEVTVVGFWELNRGDDGGRENDCDISKTNKEINHGIKPFVRLFMQQCCHEYRHFALKDKGGLRNAEAGYLVVIDSFAGADCALYRGPAIGRGAETYSSSSAQLACWSEATIAGARTIKTKARPSKKSIT